MKEILEKFQSLSKKQKIGIVISGILIFLLLLPNTFVYALAGVAAYRLTNNKVWKYSATILLGTITFFSGILWIVGDEPSSQIAENNGNPSTLVQGNKDATLTPEIKQVPIESASAEEQSENPQEVFYAVTAVVDGDTLKVNIDSKDEALRLIGMDTPETVDPRKPVQCFAKEASAKAKETLAGKKVRLEADPSQGERDKYGRLLRYIFLEDGTFFNQMMIEDGYSHEYTYNTPYKYQQDFKQAETRAREGKKGLWGDLCNGDTAQAAKSSTTTPVPVPILIPDTNKQSSGSTGWACNCKKTCAAMSCQEAQFQLDSCGCSARDADKDGAACDSQCQ